MTSPRWWNKDRYADTRPFLMARSKIKSGVRDWFETQDFVEVECATLQISPGNETHLHAFKTELLNEDGTHAQTYYLHTSPEFASKKILAAGEPRIFDFARVYRNREVSPTHSPEFTMLEWYRAGAKLVDVMRDTQSIICEGLNAIGGAMLNRKQVVCDPFAEAQFLTLTDAFTQIGIDLPGVLEDREAFAKAAIDIGVHVQSDDAWTDIFSAVLVSKIEPFLGTDRLTFLYNYPLCEAALARPCPDDPRFAERFEVYACGVELANGFGELTDPVEQRKRFEDDMDLKQRIYGERYPIDEDFLAALEHMPESSGVALGFDRLVMLCTGANHINDVLWTPLNRA